MMSFESLYIPVISWSLSMLMDYHIPEIPLQIFNSSGLFTDFSLDPHESSCFDWRSQKLTQLIGSIKIKYFVVQIESLVKLFS